MKMRKSLYHNRLGSTCGNVRRFRAFSLAELVVSIGVLLLMFSLVGQVFSLTMRSTGEALAYTEINQLLRIFEDTLREDLRHVEPGQSLILIQCNPVNAYWTQDGLEADKATGDDDPSDGYPHLPDPPRESDKVDGRGDLIPIPPRADLLMIFTARKGTSFVNPAVTSALQQVVYGHAELGEYVRDPSSAAASPEYDFSPGRSAFPVNSLTKYPNPDSASEVPARQWHLARRSVQLLPTDVSGGLLPTEATLWDEKILNGEADTFGLFSYEELVLTPRPAAEPWHLPRVFDTANFGEVKPWNRTLEFNAAEYLGRSQLDPTPPPTRAVRLGHYFVPNCASFKVEWALDPRSAFVNGRLEDTTEIFWFDQALFDANDPGVHPLTSLQRARDAAEDAGDFELSENLRSLQADDTIHPDGRVYSLSDRFAMTGDPDWILGADQQRQNLVVFGAARRSPPSASVPLGEIVEEDIFPGALRITIDLYDDTRRLDRPIRHVMVIPVGS